MEYDLLDKTELKIEGIHLNGANLTEIAAVVASVLGLEKHEVLVIDVREPVLALDVLRPHVNPHIFAGRQRELLERLSGMPGVGLEEYATVTSKGMLGWIAAGDPELFEETLQNAERSVEEYKNAIRKRVIVFSSGIEVEKGQIQDTNTPMLAERLERVGFHVTKGPTLKDDVDLFTGKLRNAIDDGYGIIITTGGVGAEDKDFSVEATLRLDPDAAVPYLVQFETLGGRHHKKGIRIGVGQVDYVRIINLPGPNDEVSACLDILAEGLKNNLDKFVLAEGLAEALRNRLREKMQRHRTDGERHL